MPRKSNTNSTALVTVYEMKRKKGIRFGLRYSLNGKQIRELLLCLPLVQKSDRVNYKETKTKADAIAFERTKEIREGRLGYSSRKNNLLLKDWFEMCVERAQKQEQEDSNHHKWSGTIAYTGKVVEQYHKGAKLKDVDKDFIIGFIDYLKNDYVIGRRVQNAGQHLKPRTIEKKITTFSYVLNMAFNDGIIARNPFSQLTSTDKIRVPKSEPRFLEEEQLKKLAKTPIKDEKTRQVYLFICFCGLRISDVKALKWGDIRIDGDHWLLTIRQKKTKEPLYLPLSETAKKLLPERGDATDNDFVFDNIPCEQTMNRHLKEWAKAAGINEKLTLHTGRHTFATLSLTKGVDLYTTSKLLGHANIHTTEIYAKIVDEKKVEAANKLNNILPL